MEKINIAELLKDCPKGMELDCTMYEDVSFVKIVNSFHYPIAIKTKSGFDTKLTKYGQSVAIDCAKCVIFPKGKTTWEGFKKPFDDGDIVATEHGLFIGIVRVKNNMQVNAYCSINDSGRFEINSTYGFERIATEEEKQKLFEAIKENGYKWNAETKTLDKLIEQKFDITTLRPFNKVLVRDTNRQVWTADLFSHIMSNTNPNLRTTFVCVGHYPDQCIPFEGNEHLLGTIDDCDEYFKNW